MLLAGLLAGVASADDAEASGPGFGDVAPLFQARCVVCHGPQGPQRGLDLTSLDAILRGGESGPAIEVGASGKSLLMDKLVSGSMPPGGPKLSAEELGRVRNWIDLRSEREAEALGVSLVTEADVLPILQARCVVCHGKSRQRGGLDLRTQEARLRGGDSGPAIVPGKPDQSLLLHKVKADLMPPPEMQLEFAVRNPSEAEVKTLRDWIAAGCPPAPEPAEDPVEFSEAESNFWAFTPPARPAVPAVEDADLVVNPIDAFLLARLEAEGLTYAPRARPRELLRRAYYDLTGMPPTPEQALEFLEDPAPDRYDRLIDRLLDSPAYGERWARHWLDVAGYSESESRSSEAPKRDNAWRYRDYVIRSLNADKPFDVFLTEQLAGDEMAPWKDQPVTPELVDRLAATGYLRTASDPTWQSDAAFLLQRMDVLADQVQILSSGLLGLTVGCARCHDHKYDPIRQRDFYSLSAILQSAYDPYEWRRPAERSLPIALPDEAEEATRHNAPLEAEIAQLEKEVEDAAAPFRDRYLEESIPGLPASLRADLRALAGVAPEERTTVQKYLAAKFWREISIPILALRNQFDELKRQTDPLQERIRELQRRLKPKPEIRALTDLGGQPSTSYLLLRGDALTPGPAVEPSPPRIASAHIAAYRPAQPPDGVDSSGRRLGLARWLTQPDHPLLSRVLMNRIWMRHFGRGIVASVDNFGKLGDAPTHPELLDWLAVELVEGGWTLKRMHRMMLTSRAYQQSSFPDPAVEEADPDNRWLARMPRRRVDADQLFDSLLRASGRLDPSMFGPPAELDVKPSGEVEPKATDAGYRRSVYTLQQPLQSTTLLEVFDFPQMAPNCTARSSSNVATQALQLMNSRHSWDLARHLAGRVIDEQGVDPRAQIEAVFQRVLIRPPDSGETDNALAALETFETHWLERVREEGRPTPAGATASWLALSNLAHTLLNSAEFAFID